MTRVVRAAQASNVTAGTRLACLKKSSAVMNSKTYYCWREEGTDKYSSKSLSKRTNALDKKHFASVLKTKESISGKSRGFVKKDELLRTYEQERASLSYFYGKRKVHEDGVSTAMPDV